MSSKWQSEQVWRDALLSAREQLRSMKIKGEGAQRISRQRRQVERIRSAGLPTWQERIEWGGFKFPPSSD